MDNRFKKPSYNFECAAFKERETFFKQTLDINLKDYFAVRDDNDIIFEDARLYKDILYKTLADYQKANSSMFAADFDLEAYISGISDDDAKKVPIIVFDRYTINKIYHARGNDIVAWMQTNLKNFSDRIIALKKSPDITAMAEIMVTSSVVGIDGSNCNALVLTYGELGALAEVPMEGPFSIAEAIAALVASLPATAVLVIAAVAAISIILVAVALLERKLVSLIVNDTKYDITVEDIYMNHGKMTAKIDDTKYKNVIPGKKRENEVYASFFVIEKVFGFVGTECTMRLRFDYTGDSYYLLTANPLSEKSRINFTLRNDDATHHFSSKSMHDSLYSTGTTEFNIEYQLFTVSGHLNSESGEDAYCAIYFKQKIDDYVDFWFRTEYLGSLYCTESYKFGYDGMTGVYEIKPGGFCCFGTKQPMEKAFYVELMTKDADTSLVYTFGGEGTIDLAANENFIVYPLPYIYDSSSPYGSSENALIKLSNPSAKSSIYIRSIEARYMQTPIKNTDWMSKLPDNTPLADINIPGTHDSAAINKKRSTPYACHYSDITKQLTSGIRLLDVRIKVKVSQDQYTFVTCHGNMLSKYDVNEYQSLPSLLDECKVFLNRYPTETIIMSLKIDDFPKGGDRDTAYKLLAELLAKYPIQKYNTKLGSLGNSRGKIVLFNRIDSNWEQFGYPIFWADNTTGSYAESGGKRDFQVFVQDYWNTFSIYAANDKWSYVLNAMRKKKAGDSTVIWNYASGCWFYLRGLNIGEDMLRFFGQEKSNRLTHFGWVFMDYEDTTYSTDYYGMMDLPSIIISSNFGYAGCSSPFKYTKFNRVAEKLLKEERYIDSGNTSEV